MGNKRKHRTAHKCGARVGFIGNKKDRTLHIDGMHFGDAWAFRAAYNSTNIASNKLKVKVVVDNVGKDDTLLC